MHDGQSDCRIVLQSSREPPDRVIGGRGGVGVHIILTPTCQTVLTEARWVLSLCFGATERELVSQLLDSAVGQRLTRPPALNPCSN